MLPRSDIAVSLMSTHIAYSPVISLEREWVFWSEKLATTRRKRRFLKWFGNCVRGEKSLCYFFQYSLSSNSSPAEEHWRVNDTNLADNKKAFVAIPIDTFGQMLWDEEKKLSRVQCQRWTLKIAFEDCLRRLYALCAVLRYGCHNMNGNESFVGLRLQRSTRDY